MRLLFAAGRAAASSCRGFRRLRLLLGHDAELLARHREQSAALAAAEARARESATRLAEAARAAARAVPGARGGAPAQERPGGAPPQRPRRASAPRWWSSRRRRVRWRRPSRTSARTSARGASRRPRGRPSRAAPRASRRRWTRPIARGFGRVVDGEFLTETFRTGVEFEAPLGTPVQAVAAGQVRFAGWFRGYGRLVILDHGDGYFTVSGHLDGDGRRGGRRACSRGRGHRHGGGDRLALRAPPLLRDPPGRPRPSIRATGSRRPARGRLSRGFKGIAPCRRNPESFAHSTPLFAPARRAGVDRMRPHGFASCSPSRRRPGGGAGARRRRQAGSVAASTRYEDLSLFTSVLKLVRRNYVEAVDERELVHGAVRGMLAGSRPALVVPRRRGLQGDAGRHQGRVPRPRHRDHQAQDGFIEVVSPIEGTPADRAGIKARDQIIAICPTELPEDWDEDCRSTKDMTLFEAVSLMRGQQGHEDHDRDLPRGLRAARALHDRARRGEGRLGERPDARARLRLRAHPRLPGAHDRTTSTTRLEELHAEAGDALRRAGARPARQPGRPARPGGQGGRRVALRGSRRLHEGPRRQPAPGVPRPRAGHRAAAIRSWCS